MKYLKKISSDTEIVMQSYDVVYYNETTKTTTVKIAPKPNAPLKFTATGDSTLRLINFGGNTPILYKSTDGKTWELWDYSIINIADGQSVHIKGDNPNGISTNVFKSSLFIMTGSIACKGNVMSLLGEYVTDIPCDYCYQNMFEDCTSLTTAPELPATTLTQNCYDSMFRGCTSLTTAPELPATTLANYCYQSMFRGCTSLTTAPVLPATILADYCYYNMFQDCSKLNYIKVGATSWNISNTRDWVSGVSSTGTFVKPSATTIESSTDGIPNGWTVENV